MLGGPRLVLLCPAPGPSANAPAPPAWSPQMLGGLFGRGGGQAVRQLLELRCMERRLLCAIHEGGQLRLWDLPTRR